MKRELICIAAFLYWAALVSVVLPWMVSSASTELVLGGFALLLVSTYVTYRVIRRFIKKGITP